MGDDEKWDKSQNQIPSDMHQLPECGRVPGRAVLIFKQSPAVFRNTTDGMRHDDCEVLRSSDPSGACISVLGLA